MEDIVADMFQLSGITRRKEKQMRLGANLTEDHRVLDGDRRIASWSIDGRKLLFNFVDEDIGTVEFAIKNPNEFFGKTKSPDGDSWTWTLKRIQIVSVWNTQRQGQLTFYSNGRVNGPDGQTSSGYWSLVAGKLKFRGFSCTFSSDRESFSGRGPDAVGISGRLVVGGTGFKK